jgi:hypothetical protein
MTLRIPLGAGGRGYDEIVSPRLPTMTLIASSLAALLAFASAAVSAYWLLGGTALLDTVGGALERLARDRSAGALALASVVVVVKLGAGAFALALLRWPSRRLAGLAAAVGGLLALYGAVLIAVGALALVGIFGSSAPSDEHALRWHVVFWDPWFLVWGVALAVAGTTIRRATQRSRGGDAVAQRRRRDQCGTGPLGHGRAAGARRFWLA